MTSTDPSEATRRARRFFQAIRDLGPVEELARAAARREEER